MTDTGADSTYSDDQIYRLVRRIMAEPKAIRQGSRLLLQRARRRSSDRHPARASGVNSRLTRSSKKYAAISAKISPRRSLAD